MTGRSTWIGSCGVSALLVLAGGGCGGGGSGSVAQSSGQGQRTVAAAVVQPLPAGWSQTDDGPNLLTARGARASTTITSWDYTPGRAGPAADMPKEGILITTLLFRAGGPSLCDSTPRLRGYPNRSTAHLSLRRAERGVLEGVPQTPELRIRGRHNNDYNFEVRVAIRSAVPRPDLVEKAQHVLARLHFPDWPHACA